MENAARFSTLRDLGGDVGWTTFTCPPAFSTGCAGLEVVLTGDCVAPLFACRHRPLGVVFEGQEKIRSGALRRRASAFFSQQFADPTGLPGECLHLVLRYGLTSLGEVGQGSLLQLQQTLPFGQKGWAALL